MDDLALSSLSLSGEDWFDGPALHQAFRRKAIAGGARFVAADVRGFENAADRVAAMVCRDGRRFEGDAVLLTAGVWYRPEGRGFLAGAPTRHPWPGDPDEPPLNDVDHGLFDEVIWPRLAARVPAFEALRVRSAWAVYYEMNAFDHNGLACRLPGWSNAYTACGFSGHGMQQAPAVGAAMAALIAGGSPAGPAGTPALDDLAPGRLAAGRALREHNVI